MASSRGYIALIGSGELSDTLAETHRMLMNIVSQSLDEVPRPVFVDTLAGFELNVGQIGQKAVAYFQRNFGVNLALAAYRHPGDSTEAVAAAVTAIRQANYIFAGPGSPSYGLRAWRGSPVWNAIVERWQAGAMLVFASAASITLGSHALPVYEIYKVGQDAHWLDGLNLLGTLGLKAAVIPHWNNHSGDHHDTRFCFMGLPRLMSLEAALPADTAMLGIDEYTTLLIDPATRSGQVIGAGEVIWRHRSHQRAWQKGERFTFDLESLDANAPDLPLESLDESQEESIVEINDIGQIAASADQALKRKDLDAASRSLLALTLIIGAGLEQDVLDRADAAAQALQRLMPQLGDVAGYVEQTEKIAAARDALINMLIVARAELRKAKQWAVADRIRDDLNTLGVTLTDTPSGTTWQYLPANNGSS